MQSEKRMRITKMVASDRPIEAYGGFRLARQGLEELLKKVRDGSAPLTSHHDFMQKWDAECLDAYLIDLPDGTTELRATFEVNKSEWEAYEADCASKKMPGGMSYTCGKTIAELEAANPQGIITSISISGDAAYFTEDNLKEAANKLTVLGPVKTGLIWQFGASPACRIIIELVNLSVALGPGILSNALWEGIKYLYQHRKAVNKDVPELPEPMWIDFRERKSINGSIERTFQIVSSDPGVIECALNKLPEIVGRPEELLRWDNDIQNWKAP